MDRLLGKAALVTGAAQGIGLACAAALAGEGAAVTLLDINGFGAQQAADDIRGAGGQAEGMPGDVARETDIQQAVEATVARFGRLDILVNNAAAFGPETEGKDLDVETTPLEVWDRTFAVNLRGAFLGAHYAVPHMLASDPA